MFKSCLEPLKNKTAIVCVSGGADSMVLLELVNKYKKELSITPYVCHFEHGIRGEDSKADMDLVKKRCEQFNIPLLLKQENIPDIANGKSLEQVARERRYAFFYECMEEKNADCLVLAHHKGDNCETVLMNIIRGCGVAGLCGMENTDTIIRPLLGFSKQQLYKYADENNVPFNEDITNKDNKYLRNSIRNELIPFLESKNPRFCDGLERLRQIATVENDFWTQYVENSGGITKTEYGYDISIELYAKSHKALQQRTVYYVLKELCGTDYDFNLFEDISALMQKQTGKKVETHKGLNIYKTESALSFVKERPKIDGEYKICLDGKTATPFGIFTICFAKDLSETELKSLPKNTVYVGEDIKNAALSVRSRKNGDTISAFGGETKRVKELLIDKKVPVFLRDSVPIVCANGEILWIPGVSRGKGYPVKKSSGYKITYIPEKYV